MILSLNVPAFAIDTADNTADTGTTSSTGNGNLKIEVTTDKDSYKVLNVATFTVIVTNTSNEAIQNVSAEAVFTDLAPVKKGMTKAETETLEAGESLTLSYKATLNKNEHNLNIFQKIFLWIVRLFNGGYTASDNGFNDGRDYTEQITSLMFGKFQADNVVRVWYGENGSEIPDNPTTQDKTYEELINGVDIDEIYTYDDNDISIDEETGEEYINNILLIIFDEDCSDERKAEIINSINGEIVGGRDWANELHVKIKNCTIEELESICDMLNNTSGVLDADYDDVHYMEDNAVSFTPNDPYIIDSYSEDSNIFNNLELAWNDFAIANSPLQISYRNWYHLAIQTTEAWKYNSYFDNINIGIIDSGFATEHEDLNIQIVSKNNTQSNHGTHVAGIIGAMQNNEIGSAGIIKNASLFGYTGKKKMTSTEIYNGLDTLVRNYNCKVINLSMGQSVYEFDGHCYQSNNKINPLTDAEVDRWGKKASKEIALLLKDGRDFVVVQSAGNGAENTNLGIDADNNGFFSSITADNCYTKIASISINDIISRVIVVGNATTSYNISTGISYMLTADSNGGSSVNIAAPGEFIYSTVAGVESTDNDINQGQQYAILSGTSMASPIVAGVAGLVWSVNPNFTGAQVKDIVINSAYDGGIIVADNPSSPTTGDFPLVNAGLAVEEAIRQTYGIGSVIGYVNEQDTHSPLANITITATSDGKTLTAQTNKNGEFNIKLPVGDWKISVESTDTHYCTEKRTVTVEKNKEVTLSPPFYMKEGAEVSGTVKDKNTDTPIANATIEVFDISNTLIMEGIDGTYNYEDFKLGELITTTTTDENGNYSISLPSGKYAIAVNHDNYNFNGILLTVEQGFDEYLSQNILLTPKSEDDRTVIASGECGDDVNNLTWKLYDDGELVLSGTGNMNGYHFGRNAPWYTYNESIKTATIKSGIIGIGNGTFANHTSLEKVYIEYGLKYLHSVRTNGYTQKDYTGTFSGCRSLKEVYIPDSVTFIGEKAFSGCTSLCQITIPDSVTKIGGGAFSGCSSLTTINLGNSITELNDATYFSTNLMGSHKLYSMGFFEGCTSLKSITIPNSITYIGNDTFANCTSLKEVLIPNSVTSMGKGVFYGCSSLETIQLSNNIICIQNPKNLLEDYIEAYGYKFDYDDDYGFFENCINLKNIAMPKNLQTIGDYAFSGCTSLESIIIPESVTSIGNYAFHNCTSLASITIPDSVTSIGSGAFSNCKILGNITIPDSVTSIGSSAFSNCKILGNITIPDSVTSIGDYAFSHCTSITELKLSENLTELGSYAFFGCTSLNRIDLGNSLTKMGYCVFNDCYNLKSLTLPASINYSSYYSYFSTGVRYGALGESYIETVTIADGATSIPAHIFASAEYLKNVTIPESVTSIGDYAFYNCTSLAGITISNSSCTIYDSENTIASNTVIYGYAGSTAEAYAQKYGREFVAIG